LNSYYEDDQNDESFLILKNFYKVLFLVAYNQLIDQVYHVHDYLVLYHILIIYLHLILNDQLNIVKVLFFHIQMDLINHIYIQQFLFINISK
jgi:hypothetical protein